MARASTTPDKATPLPSDVEKAATKDHDLPAEPERATQPPDPAPTLRSALASTAPPGERAGRRLSWKETVSVEYYEPCQDRPVDNYKQNLDRLSDLRRSRHAALQPDLSFAELVSELDASDGGEGLDCLAPRRVEPAPGAWMQSGMTWGQINQSSGYGNGGSSYSSSYSSRSSGWRPGGSAGYSSAVKAPATVA